MICSGFGLEWLKMVWDRERKSSLGDCVRLKIGDGREREITSLKRERKIDKKLIERKREMD